MRIELTENQINTLQIALSEMFNTDTWTEGLTDKEISMAFIDANRLIKLLNKNK